MILRFGSCELDLDRVVLRRDGHEIPVEPQVFDVLSYLAQHRGKVVRKAELLDEVWGDRFVSESALTTRIKLVRQAVDDDGTRQAIIRTVHGKGYEFIAEVEVVESPTPERAPPPAPAPNVTAGLPAAVEPLIGRETLLALLVDAARAHRLITLVGTGGVGKTSLGLELARAVASDHADGVNVVELVRVVDEDATLAAVATTIDVNLRRSSSIEDAILEMLRPWDTLLVLDNCEHLIEPVAALVNRILREAPRVSLLATSREPLAVAGEQVWSVEPLSTAGGWDIGGSEPRSIPAVTLFVERARAADPSFRLDELTGPLVVEICQRLDGIPLAIELAAARARSIGIAEMARRLDERFSLLKAMRRGSDPRHRTMHDAISWSYDLLEADEQELFTALSVFVGSFDLGAAEWICTSGDALDLLTRLAERSMLSVHRREGGATRYELLETLRDYGRTRLGDERAGALFRAHASHFAAEAEKTEVVMHGPDERSAITGAASSFADLRAAQRFALEIGALDDAFRLIASIREFAMRTMRYEVFAWADAARTAPGALEHPLAPLLTGMSGYGAWVRGDFDVAADLAHEARELETALAVPPSGLAERVLGNVLYIVGQGELGNVEASRQIALAEASGDRSRLVHACYMGAVALSSLGDYGEAAQLVRRAYAEARVTASPTDLASAAVAEGFSARATDDALEAFVAADQIAREAGNRWMSAFARTEVGGLLVHRGDVEEGCAGLAETVALWYRAGEWSQQWHTLSRCMVALHRIGQTALAAELVGAIETHAMLAVAPLSSILYDVVLATREALFAELGVMESETRLAAGAACPVEDIVHRTRMALLGEPLPV